jgi:hypothetical protein
MDKKEKKTLIIVGCVGVAFVVLLYLLRKTNGVHSRVTNGAGQPADTYYLTSNIPPINSSGVTVPNFGPVTIGNGSGGGYGGCNGCDVTSQYGSSFQLAQALSAQNMDNYDQAVQDALNAAGYDVDVSGGIVTGSQTMPASGYNIPPVMALN